MAGIKGLPLSSTLRGHLPCCAMIQDGSKGRKVNNKNYFKSRVAIYKPNGWTLTLSLEL
jgi:hypothetical protein